MGYQVVHNGHLDRERAAIAEDAARAFDAERLCYAAEIAKTRENAANAIARAEAAEVRAEAAETAARTFMAATFVRAPTDVCRPLYPLTSPEIWRDAPRDIGALAASIASMPAFEADIVPYFASYPRKSFLSDYCRGYLYALVRARRPARVLEIGTLHAGTTEVIARALHENGHGVVHTIDPFGAERVPPVIATWPQGLRAIVDFSAVGSMTFLARSADLGRRFDLVLVDGQHDFEFALFDILMSARLITRGGIIVVDNVEQSGPYAAAQRFIADNPEWTHLPGQAAPSAGPFDETERRSLPSTSFILLQAPANIIVRDQVSWGQQAIPSPAVAGFSLHLGPCPEMGVLHYQAILRGFGDSARRIEEFKNVGQLAVGRRDHELETKHLFKSPLQSPLAQLFADAYHTFELELAWTSKGGQALHLKTPPTPIVPM
jgi:hypothetical protein